MNASEAVYKAILDSGVDFVTSVPCANLKTVLNYLNDDKDIQHIPVTREEEGIGVCTGAYLGGRKTALLMQNSGLGNSINAIGSLVKVYKIPILIIISHRGFKGKNFCTNSNGPVDQKLLETVEIPYFNPKTPDEAYKLIKDASELSINMEYPVAILLDALYWEHDK